MVRGLVPATRGQHRGTYLARNSSRVHPGRHALSGGVGGGEEGKFTSGPDPPVSTTHSHFPPRSPSHLGELSTEAPLAVTLSCCPAEICEGRRWWEGGLHRGVMQERRDIGEGGGRGNLRKDLPEPNSEHKTNGGRVCRGLYRKGTHRHMPTLVLPERQGAYSRIWVKLSVER